MSKISEEDLIKLNKEYVILSETLELLNERFIQLKMLLRSQYQEDIIKEMRTPTKLPQYPDTTRPK